MKATQRDSRKRKMQIEDRLRYKNLVFEKWEYSAHNLPGIPHRYFQDVYTVHKKIEDVENEMQISIEQVVHRHANGLVIVTAGNSIDKILQQVDSKGEHVTVEKFEFNINVNDSATSVGGKRKKTKSMKNGAGESETVNPNDTLATLHLSNGLRFEFKCCVAGSLIETNSKLIVTNSIEDANRCKSLLQNNPLLDGYLGVILPLGKFPSLN